MKPMTALWFGVWTTPRCLAVDGFRKKKAINLHLNHIGMWSRGHAAPLERIERSLTGTRLFGYRAPAAGSHEILTQV